MTSSWAKYLETSDDYKEVVAVKFNPAGTKVVACFDTSNSEKLMFAVLSVSDGALINTFIDKDNIFKDSQIRPNGLWI